jgi:manganese-dependent inorganic pyrophosphatase
MSDSELLVIGHRNPDTDAICSAIGYAEFKRRTGSPHVHGDTADTPPLTKNAIAQRH